MVQTPRPFNQSFRVKWSRVTYYWQHERQTPTLRWDGSKRFKTLHLTCYLDISTYFMEFWHQSHIKLLQKHDVPIILEFQKNMLLKPIAFMTIITLILQEFLGSPHCVMDLNRTKTLRCKICKLVLGGHWRHQRTIPVQGKPGFLQNDPVVSWVKAIYFTMYLKINMIISLYTIIITMSLSYLHALQVSQNISRPLLLDHLTLT